MNNRLPMTLEHKYIDFFIWICIIISLVLNLSARYIDGFAQWYVANIYPIFPTVIGRIYSLLNFSFFEAGLIFFALLICIYLLKGLCLILINDSRKKSFLSSGVRVLLLVSAGLIMMYTLFCSINYQRHDIGEILQLPNNEISGDNLEKLSLILADDLMILIKDEDWKENLKLMHDKDYIESESVNAMKQLAFIEPSFSGYYPRVKAIYNSDILTRFGIEGFFSPYTMEANYNSEMAPFLLPYTICHELAHLKGYMRENDAGFISYLACKNSSSKIFQYSGTFKALTYTLQALKSEIGVQKFNEVYQKLPKPVKEQLNYIKEPKLIAEPLYLSITKKVNNIYLQANAQSNGIESYVNMVNYLLSYYADTINPDGII